MHCWAPGSLELEYQLYMYMYSTVCLTVCLICLTIIITIWFYFCTDPPEFTNVSATQTVVEGGSSITLHCIAIGEPLPSITWTRVFDNGNDSDVLFTGEQFVLDNDRSSSGTYRCTANNGIGTAPNRTIAVDVICK